MLSILFKILLNSEQCEGCSVLQIQSISCLSFASVLFKNIAEMGICKPAYGRTCKYPIQPKFPNHQREVEDTVWTQLGFSHKQFKQLGIFRNISFPFFLHFYITSSVSKNLILHTQKKKIDSTLISAHLHGNYFQTDKHSMWSGRSLLGAISKQRNRHYLL